jgi:hypothetical protein
LGKTLVHLIGKLANGWVIQLGNVGMARADLSNPCGGGGVRPDREHSEGGHLLARKTHKKNSKAASVYCKLLLLNKLNLTKRTPLQ